MSRNTHNLMTKEARIASLTTFKPSRTQKRLIIEKVIEVLLFLAASSSVLTTFGIMEILI